jgi:hypothetical protein
MTRSVPGRTALVLALAAQPADTVTASAPGRP